MYYCLGVLHCCRYSSKRRTSDIIEDPDIFDEIESAKNRKKNTHQSRKSASENERKNSSGHDRKYSSEHDKNNISEHDRKYISEHDRKYISEHDNEQFPDRKLSLEENEQGPHITNITKDTSRERIEDILQTVCNTDTTDYSFRKVSLNIEECGNSHQVDPCSRETQL